MSIKDVFYFLWTIGMWPRSQCPFCGKELNERGRKPMIFWVCPDDDCRFNANEKSPD